MQMVLLRLLVAAVTTPIEQEVRLLGSRLRASSTSSFHPPTTGSWHNDASFAIQGRESAGPLTRPGLGFA